MKKCILVGTLLITAGAGRLHAAENVGKTTQPLTADKTITLWTSNNNTVPVCWETAGYDREKKIVKEAVQGTWEFHANINFTGWDTCPTEGEASHVRMRIDSYGDENAGAMGRAPVFGTGALSKPAEKRTGVIFQFKPDGKADQSRVEYIAAHEFGHILGFMHEQDGAGNVEGPAHCAQITGTGDNAKPVTEYDRDSVMNYCNKFGNMRGDLTDIDIKGAHEVYGIRRHNLASRNSCSSSLIKQASSLAAPWNDGGAATFAVFPSDRTKFLYHSQWNVKDGGWMDNAKWMAGDFNGDGLTDIGAAWNNGGTNVLTVRQSTGSAFTHTHWLVNAGGWMDSTVWLPGDFNGDGRTDIAGVWNDGGSVTIAVFLSDGTKFPGWTQWSVKDGGWMDNVKWVAGDFNGDGRTDIGAAWNNGGQTTLTVRPSTGSGFGHVHWLADAGDWTESGTFVAGDFNADGRADIVRLWEDLGKTSSQVYLSSGTQFQAPVAWTTRDGGWGSEVKWTAADFDGDGLTDLNATWNHGGTNVLTVRRSTGSAFNAAHWSTNAGGWMDSTAWCAGRFN
ncbi:hypothetical protein D3871_28020 [Noviherbaspirillum saxi]|uniref:Peptidase metallopeptidase domain-containing protein n=2 Tax=Noviherbaspirillum saxi TaxID=2320863 RepID=A0A3A3G419_9BURK|nr:hypothetical protein D3871_28020 [Noviherbaspirillum saxi]